MVHGRFIDRDIVRGRSCTLVVTRARFDVDFKSGGVSGMLTHCGRVESIKVRFLNSVAR